MKLRSSRLARLDGGIALSSPPRCIGAVRHIHQTKADRITLAASSSSPGPPAAAIPYAASTAPTAAALSCLPLAQVLRTYLITSISSSPVLLQACFEALTMMLHSKSSLTSVENPVFKLLLRETFYKQFCTGTTIAEVQQNIKHMHNIGYSGVILEYALEVLADAKDVDPVKDVDVWRNGLLQTVDMASPGDFVGLKWSGLGPKALQLLKSQKPPTAAMDEAMREVCSAAAAKKISLLPAAEETTTTPTIDAWSLGLQRDFNRNGTSVVYNTYQAYLKSTPGQIAKHLADARHEDYTLGIKLVRGAYLGSEVRNLIWPSIEATHAAYDNIAEALLRKEFIGRLQPLHGHDAFKYPDINLVLATHNVNSVRKVLALRTQLAREKKELVPLAYAQLQGMADEVSCELIQAGKAEKEEGAELPRVYKCTTWGSMEECLNYLLRRASENKDAASRTAESRLAMGRELRRRFRGVFGLSA